MRNRIVPPPPSNQHASGCVLNQNRVAVTISAQHSRDPPHAARRCTTPDVPASRRRLKAAFRSVSGGRTQLSLEQQQQFFSCLNLYVGKDELRRFHLICGPPRRTLTLSPPAASLHSCGRP